MSELEAPEAVDIKPDMEIVAELANKLVTSDPDFGQLVASMLASRQLYAMCVYELEWLLREEAGKPKAKPELTSPQKVMLKEVLINAAAVQAQQPFEEQVLFDGMKQIVFPWMERVVVNHSRYQNSERKKIFEAQEKVRVETSIELGFKISDLPLNRQSSVLLVGEAPVVNYVLRGIIDHAIDSYGTVKQIVELVECQSLRSDSRVVSVPVSEWKGCAGSNNGFQKVYEAFVATQLSNPVDLLVVHNLLPAQKGLEHTSLATRANESQFKFKRWANAAGALLVSGLPLDRQLRANELHSTEYETLRVHNVIRGVTAVPVPNSDDVEIVVGTVVATRIPRSEVYAS